MRLLSLLLLVTAAMACDPAPAGATPYVPVTSGFTPSATVPVLHSRPGSANVLVLDCYGGLITNSIWNDFNPYQNPGPFTAQPFDSDGNPSVFSDAEQTAVVEIWRRVAEHFAPFNIDVTTEIPVTWTMSMTHLYLTKGQAPEGTLPSGNTTSGNCYTGTFGALDPNHYPAFIYCDMLINRPDFIAEAATHMVGHTLGLNEACQIDPVTGATLSLDYTGQTIAGTTKRWAPIMGDSFTADVSQWSKGEYTGAKDYSDTNFADEVSIIASHLGYVADAPTSQVTDLSSGTWTGQTSLISTTSDTDTYTFTVPSAVTVSFTATPLFTTMSSFAASMQVIDANGTIVSVSDGTTLPVATLTDVPLMAGTYTLVVSVGAFNTGADGFTSYGSLGHYSLMATVTNAIGFTASVNFQPTTSALPTAGTWVKDSGQAIHTVNGLTFGWNAALPTALMADRNSSLSPNQAYDTIAAMAQAPAKGNKWTKYAWKLTLPRNGKYKIRVMTGDPATKNVNGAQNGVVVKGRTFSANAKANFPWNTFEVTQSIIDASVDLADWNNQSVLSYVQVWELTQFTPTSPQ